MIEILSLAFVVLVLIFLCFAIFSKNLLHTVYAVFTILFLIAGIFIILGSDFLGASQVMVYIGGILIVILFGLMVTNVKSNLVKTQQNHNLGFGVVSVILMLLLSFSSYSIIKNTADVQAGSQVQNIGNELVTNQLIGFEIIGFLLLIALIGSTFIASKK